MIKLIKHQYSYRVHHSFLAGTFYLMGVDDEVVLKKWDQFSARVSMFIQKEIVRAFLFVRQYPMVISLC